MASLFLMAQCMLLLLLLIIIIVANLLSQVQQRGSSTSSNRKHTMAPLAAAIRFVCDLGTQLTARGNELYVTFCWGGKTREPGEKPLKQRREPTQTQPTYGVGSGNRTWATLVGGECSHHCAIPAPLLLYFLICLCPTCMYPPSSKALFIWSRVPEITLPPSYPWRDIFPLICFKNSINHLHEVGATTRVGETTWGGELPCLGR